VNADDERLARISRVLRRKAGLRQVDLIGAGRSRHFVRALENGEGGRLRVDQVRDHFRDLGGRLRMNVSWNGAEIDRLLDERHASVVEQGAAVVRSYGWPTLLLEMTFSEFGERGSIDPFAADESRSAVFVGEAKSAWGSIEETNRRLDMKARLAPKLTFDRFGWRPLALAKVLIFPDDRTARRTAARFEATLGAAYPARAREIRAWLRKPSGTLAGIWFLSNVR
jgi:hypothetical protein